MYYPKFLLLLFYLFIIIQYNNILFTDINNNINKCPQLMLLAPILKIKKNMTRTYEIINLR